ncbi:SpaA isopeptide-forming pilin-related protein [Fundicoccus culcitae]|uniref:SpaA isopeptide-forming pilin-related protein n=1 Tax=Fundicoccus culcitae TaxID=2969821 RepID=A0ABY5P8N4_9LACT|nr:SpaA isopeptide-forming pilin-related protein [Fundicoccus culcitae]UUX35107.1 SpaA isopeptide-forming pilin-related protein [Fundicoccus culcitae]
MKLKVFVCLLMAWLLLPMQSVLASGETHRLTLVTDQADVQFQLWQIDAVVDDADATLSQLNAMDDAALTERYARLTSPPTDADGQVVITDLPAAIYYVKADAFVPFLVSLPQINTAYPKPLQATGDVVLIKYGVSGDSRELLAGVAFFLFAAADEEGQFPLGAAHNGAFDPEIAGDVLRTNDEGRIVVTGLSVGSYYFQEVATLTPFELNEERLYFDVVADETVVLEMDNYRTEIGSYGFRKVSALNAELGLRGARFKVYDEEQRYLLDDLGFDLVLESDDEGYFELVDVPLGDYWLEEIQAPVVEGVVYALLTEPIAFSVTSTSGATELMQVKNMPVTAGGVTAIPATGNWLVYGVIVLTIGIFMLGWWLYRSHGQENCDSDD